MSHLTKDQIAARLSKLITKLEKLKREYADAWDPNYGHDYRGHALVSELNRVLTLGAKFNQMYKDLTGEMYDHRFFEPKLYDELTTTGFGYHKR